MPDERAADTEVDKEQCCYAPNLAERSYSTITSYRRRRRRSKRGVVEEKSRERQS